MVLGTGFLLLISLVIRTALTVISKWFSASVPVPAWLLQSVHQLVSFAIATLLFCADI